MCITCSAADKSTINQSGSCCWTPYIRPRLRLLIRLSQRYGHSLSFKSSSNDIAWSPTFFLPERHKVKYDFRNGLHDKLLIIKTADMNDYDFITRVLYESRLSSVFILLFYVFDCCQLRVSTFIKEHDDNQQTIQVEYLNRLYRLRIKTVTPATFVDMSAVHTFLHEILDDC